MNKLSLQLTIPSCLFAAIFAGSGCSSDDTSNPLDGGSTEDVVSAADGNASDAGPDLEIRADSGASDAALEGAQDAGAADGAAPDGSSQEDGSTSAESGPSVEGGSDADGEAADGSGDSSPPADASGEATGDGAVADAVPGDLIILGTWASDFGGYEELTSTAWDDATILEYDNAARVAYTQNPANDAYDPSKFNKIVWTSPSAGSFYYCWVDYGLDDLASAKASTKVADASSPDTSGCGGFAWTKLTRVDPIEIRGTWNSNFGGTETISSRKWNDATVQMFDNAANVAFTQNPVDAQYDPSKFSKLVWTEPTAGSFYYCTVDFGLDSLAAAQASTKTADSSQPDTGGCGGFSWTKLSQ